MFQETQIAGRPVSESFQSKYWLPAALAVAIALFAVGNYGLGFNQWEIHWWADSSWTLASLAAGLKCLSVMRRMEGPRRKAWRLFGWGCLAWFFGMLVWDFLELARGEITPFPAPSDLGFLALPPLFIWGLFYYRSGSPTASLTLKHIGNLGIILSGILTASLIILYEPIQSSEASLWSSVTAICYPVFHAGAFLFGLTILWLYLWGPDRKVLLLLVAGLGVHAFTDTLYASSLLGKNYEAGHYLDAYWLVGFGFFYWAASVQTQLTGGERPGNSESKRIIRLREMETLVPAATLAAVLVVAYLFRESIQGPLAPVLLVTGLVLAGFIAAREWWSFRTASRLFDEMVQSEEVLWRSLRELEQSEGRLAGIVNIAREAIISVDRDLGIIMFNKGAEAIFGYKEAEIRGRSISVLASEDHRDVYTKLLREYSETGEGQLKMGRQIEIPGRRKKGEKFPAEASVTRLETEQGTILTVVLRDVTERVRSQKALAEQAVRDPLTGLYNRRYFNHRIEEELKRARRGGHSTAILLCDLDHFKGVNDSRGHLVGDAVLTTTAKSLLESIRGADLVFRWGGDEFVVVLSDTTREGVMIGAERIRNGLEKVNRQTSLNMDISIGAAIFPDHCEDADGLVRLADRALYIAKKSRNKVHVGEEEYALGKDTVKVQFQPVFDIRDNGIFGYEALCRDATGKLDIMDLFDKYNAIGQLNDLKILCLKYQLEYARAVGLHRVFINVDFNVLGQVDVPEKPPGIDVILEISEGDAVYDVEHHLKVVRKWRKRDFKFAIDDFGAGFISLPFIAQMKPDYVKLDRSTMLQAVARNDFRRLLKDWLEPLEHYSGGGIIAEGIETHEELEVIKKMGIHLVQGFLLGRPAEIPLPKDS